MKFSIYQASRKGTRKQNEDCIGYCYSRDALLMVVADGMGGHLNGEVAAQVTVKFISDTFNREAVPRLADPERFLRTVLVDAHHAVGAHAHRHALPETPRTTCVVCVVQDGIAHWAHVGDSRLYHLREGRIESQTRDHSNVQRLLDTGRISREAASSHPERNRIYSCLGGTAPPKVALSHGARLLAGDTILLCTDGLWGPITSQQICALLTKSDIMLAVPELLDLAEIRAGQDCDNLSAVAMTWTEQGGA